VSGVLARAPERRHDLVCACRIGRDCRMRAQRGQEIDEAPAFDDRNLVQKYLPRHELLQQLDRRQPWIEPILTGADPARVARQPAVQREQRRVLE